METEHIKAFLEVVHYGSINKASEKLHMNHQHLGRVLTQLENEIGAKLLERNRTGVTLTPQGIEVIEIMKNIDILSNQLKYNFKIDPKMKSIRSTLKIYNFARTNHARQNKFVMNTQKLLPQITIDISEAPNEKIIEYLYMNETPSVGSLCSFEDFPSLNLKIENLPSEIEIISEGSGKLTMLVSKNNPISDKYDTITIESLIAKPLVFYSPYNIEDHHFYKIIKQYGTPQIKYITSNLQTFYEILRNTDCVAIGSFSDNLDNMLNPLFRKEEQLVSVPVRENISFKIINVVNEQLKKKNGTILRNVIDQYF